MGIRHSHAAVAAEGADASRTAARTAHAGATHARSAHHRAMVAGQHHAGTGAIDAGTGMHQHLRRRQHVRARLEERLMRWQCAQRRILGQAQPVPARTAANSSAPNGIRSVMCSPLNSNAVETALGSACGLP